MPRASSGGQTKATIRREKNGSSRPIDKGKGDGARQVNGAAARQRIKQNELSRGTQKLPVCCTFPTEFLPGVEELHALPPSPSYAAPFHQKRKKT